MLVRSQRRWPRRANSAMPRSSEELMSKKLLVALLPLVVLAGPAHAEAQKTATYAEAKEIMKKNNFEPMSLKHAPDELLCDEQFCVKRPEAFYCSGVGLNYCDFAFMRKADGQIMIVETYGDDSIYVHEVRKPNKVDSELLSKHR
jgi:hypothetical protein